jgi:CDP-paratose 2-epimerase
MNFLITGGCGFIGSNLAVAMAENGHAVTCMDNLSRRGSEVLLSRILEHGCCFMHGDIRNGEDFERLKGAYDVMIECSAEPSVLVGTQGADALFLINNNLVGSVNCFEYCRTRKTPMIFLSTSRVYPYDAINRLSFVEGETRFEYGDTYAGVSSRGIAVSFSLTGYRSLYGATKLASEFLLQEYSRLYDVPSIINRCGVIAGPWQLGKVDQGVFTYWLASHHFRRDLNYIGFGGKGKQVRDLLHIEDLVSLINAQIASVGSYRGKVFNVGGGVHSNLSLMETTELCRNITGHSVNVGKCSTDRPCDLIWYIGNNDKTEREFGWKPQRGPALILSDIYGWLKDNEGRLASTLGN